MAAFDTTSVPNLPLAFQDDDHRLEAELFERATTALASLAEGRGSTEDADACLDALIRHMGAHFQREDEAMQRTAFPPFSAHQAEHQRELDMMSAQVATYRQTRDAQALLRYLSVDAAHWFDQHVGTMDVAMAKWVAAREDAPGSPSEPATYSRER